MSIEEMFAMLYAMIHYCASIAGASLIVGLVCIVGIFVMLLCMVVIDRKVNYMRDAMGILPPDAPKASLFGREKKQSKDTPKASIGEVEPTPETVKAMEKVNLVIYTDEKKED